MRPNLSCWLLVVSVLFLSAAAQAQPRAFTRYLVDGQIHVAVMYRADGGGGEISWCDTVSGARGETPFTVHGEALWYQASPGLFARAHLLPDLAVVFEAAPWQAGQLHGVLALSVD